MAADDISVLVQEAGLSPLLARIAHIVASIDGDEKARLFIESIQNEVVDPLVDENIAPLRLVSSATGRQVPDTA